jgi:hypothetical protein
MADNRTFTLIGEFRDGITPELEKINKQLATLKSSFGNVGGKGARTASRDMGRFSASVSSLVDNLKLQNQALKSATMPLREYRTEIRRTTSALERLNAAGGNTRGLNATNRALTEQLRLLRAVNSAGGNRQRMAPISPGGGGAGNMRPRGYGGGGGGYGGGGGNRSGGGMGAHMAEFGFAYTLGTGIAQPIQSAIVQGFQIGVGFMTKPFEYFAGAFGERIKDEISDLKAAGGFLSISKRSKNPFLKDIDEAIEFQQKTNETFAKMAGALPGVTNDFVQVGKRLGDTAARIVEGDFKAALDRANKIRATDEGRKFYGGQITGTGAEAKQEAITTILGELTKKTTIAGLGGRAGAGGIAGAYGLPGLTERMLSQEKVSMGQFQKYAAVFSDPTIADALNRNIERINSSSMNSSQRLDAVMKFLDEVVTPELIDKLRTSVDGVYQGLKSILFDPDSGLFGLGRNFKKFGYKINAYGEYVNKAGDAVDVITDAAKVDLSIFEILRDIFANFGAALMPLAESLKFVFDPLQSVANVLMDARHYAAEFNKVFNQYREGLKNMAKGGRSEKFEETIDVRATLATINAFLREFNVISDQQFKLTGIELMAENLDIGAMISRLIDQVLNSDIAKKIGEIIGEIVGTVLAEVSKVTGFISGRIGGTNKLFAGLRAGFDKTKGVEAFKNIFLDIFKTMLKVLGEVMKIIPFEGYMLMAAMVIAPAIIQGIGMKIAESILAGMTMFGNNLEKTIPGQIAKGGSGVLGGGAAAARTAGLGSMFLPGYGADTAKKLRNRNFDPSGGYASLGSMGSKTRGFFGTKGYESPIGPTPGPRRDPSTGQLVTPKGYTKEGYLPSRAMRGRGAGIAGGLGKMKGFMPGPAALAFGGVDAAVRMASGQDAGKALGGAAASVIGSTLGGILGQAIIPIPGVGAAIGGIAGGLIGDKVFSMLAGPTTEQQKAAQLQLQAAIQQKQAAVLNTGGVDVGKAGGAFLFGGAKDFSLRIQELGLGADKGVKSFEKLYQTDQVKQKAAATAADVLNKEIERLRATGRPNAEVAEKVRKLQDTYNAAKIDAEKSLTNLNKVWGDLGAKTTTTILNSFKNMPVGQVEAAIAERIRKIPIQNPASALRDQMPAGYDTTFLTPGTTIGEKRTDKSGLTGTWNGSRWVQAQANAKGSGHPFTGSLSEAINYEMANKPVGSDLVIANSYEEIYPKGKGPVLNAAKGYIPSQGMYSRFGSGMSSTPANITNNFTITQLPGQDSKELASIVAQELWAAMQELDPLLV